jgi:hypothetical protein
MNLRSLLIVLALASLPLVGNAADIATVRLRGIGFAKGETGQTVLVPRGETTALSVEVTGVPDDVTRPVHLYTFIVRGTCGQLEEKATYEANRSVLASSPGRLGPFRVRNTVNVALAALREGPYAVVVRSAPADGNRPMFCGEIR